MGNILLPVLCRDQHWCLVVISLQSKNINLINPGQATCQFSPNGSFPAPADRLDGNMKLWLMQWSKGIDKLIYGNQCRSANMEVAQMSYADWIRHVVGAWLDISFDDLPQWKWKNNLVTLLVDHAHRH